jgi:guanylate kinase
MSGKLFIVSASSGAGKTSLVTAALQELQAFYPLERVVTYTSKQPRPGEVHGKDYYFMTAQAFEQKIAEGFFIEWSVAYGTYYGSPRSIVEGLALGKSYIAILDYAGAQAVAEAVKEAVLIWIKVPSLAVLRQRLAARAQDTQEQIERRLALAQQEMESAQKNALFKYTILNENFDVALKNFKTIITKTFEATVG